MIDAFIKKTDSIIRELEKYYDISVRNKLISEEVKVDIALSLFSMRSVLDYLAQEIADNLGLDTDKNRYFPIKFHDKYARSKDRDNDKFFSVFIRKHFKGLEVNNSQLYNYLYGIQPFNGNIWLARFNELANENKHKELSFQEVKPAPVLEINSENSNIRCLGSILCSPGSIFYDYEYREQTIIDYNHRSPDPKFESMTNRYIGEEIIFSFGDPVTVFMQESRRQVFDIYQTIEKLLN